MKIVAIDQASPYLKDVIELGDQNKATLGFLSRGAYANHAAKRQILVAVDGRKMTGYLLYSISIRKQLAYIVHLCIKESERQKGVARALFEELKSLTKGKFRGIRVHCRREYEASKIWPKLNFAAKSEKPGRSISGSTLTIWWYDHRHPDLFTAASEYHGLPKLRVAIDANILFELHEPFGTDAEAQSLMADWIQDDLELCVTQEIFNEIDRQDNQENRRRGRAYARQFPLIEAENDIYEKTLNELQQILPETKSLSDESDRRQLAWSIAAGMQFFVTLDKDLLDEEIPIYEKFGLRVIRPSELIINLDMLIRETEYQPSRLAGTPIKYARVQSGESPVLIDTFRAHQTEKKGSFRQELNHYLADPRRYDVKITKGPDRRFLALMVFDRKDDAVLDIPILRVVKDPLSPTLIRHLLLEAVLKSLREKRAITKVTDSYITDEGKEALRELGFVDSCNAYVKANLTFVGTVDGLKSSLSLYCEKLPAASKYFEKMIGIIKAASDVDNVQSLLMVERSLWPAKLTDLSIPTFIVPIWPEWAMQLFDAEIADQDILGGDPNLILKLENVYYRSGHQKILNAPARILWYECRGKAKYQGIMGICGCSYLDEVVVDEPKVLYSQFRRLGIYSWAKVLEIAKGEYERRVMAFRFSRTEVFGLENRIGIAELRTIWKKEIGKNFHAQTCVPISPELFFRLYVKAMRT